MKLPRIIGPFLALAALASAADPPPPAPSPSGGRPRITGVSHAAFYVSDMAKARAFYEGFLGYQSPFSIPRSMYQAAAGSSIMSSE